MAMDKVQSVAELAARVAADPELQKASAGTVTPFTPGLMS